MLFQAFLLLLSLMCFSFGQKKDLIPKSETLYASSLFRRNRILEGVPTIGNATEVTGPSICLLNCMKMKPDCKSFNWGPGECTLLADSVCANETLLLSPKEGFAYFDIMDSPEFEKKHLKDRYCRRLGKCSGRCYPRKPHYVDTPMKRDDAMKFCEDLGRSLAQPRNFDENGFYANFIKNLLKEQPDTRNHKDMKYWIGISDDETEGIWKYDDGSPVSESFSAWALGQPDNGGPFGSGKENCGAVGESGDFRWFDVSCGNKLKFFCA